MTDSDNGCQVHNGIDVVHRLAECCFVADVAHHEFDVPIEIVGRTVGVDLGVERIKRAHVVACCEQAVGEVRTDKAGTSCDQNAHTRMVRGRARSVRLSWLVEWVCAAALEPTQRGKRVEGRGVGCLEADDRECVARQRGLAGQADAVKNHDATTPRGKGA